MGLQSQIGTRCPVPEARRQSDKSGELSREGGADWGFGNEGG
jgi:hypothetical protein